MAYSSGLREDVRQAFLPIVRELWRASLGGTTEAVIDLNPGAVDQLVEWNSAPGASTTCR